MEKLEKVLRSSGINVDYLNLNALYDVWGDHLIELVKCNGKISEEMSTFIFKYNDNQVISSFFNHFCVKSCPHKITYNKEKYTQLSESVLSLTNREIFMEVFEYFLNSDINYLNIDAIYDESEIYFSSLIDSIRNDTFVVKQIFGGRYFELKTDKQNISLYAGSNLMTYVEIWCSLLLAKTRSLDMYFEIRGESRCINAKTGSVFDSDLPFFTSTSDSF